MGVRSLLQAIKNRFDGKTLEVWEEANGDVHAFQNGNPLVEGTTNATSGNIGAISKLTQAQYDAIVTKDNSTLYVIVG